MKSFRVGLTTILCTLLFLIGTAHAQMMTGRGVPGNGRPEIKVDNDGRLTGGYYEIDPCDVVTGWTALGNDTTGVAVDLDHVLGSNSIEFDKVDGAANTKFGAVYKTIASVNLSQVIENGGTFGYSVSVSATTDIEYCFLRLGTSSSHYNEWRVDDDALSAGWNSVRFNADTPVGNLGNGATFSAVVYAVLGCHFDAETSTLADLRFDNLNAKMGLQVSADVNASVSSSTSTSDVNLAEVAGISTAAGAGATTTGTLRTVSSTDDPAVVDLAAIEVLQTSIDTDTAAMVVDLAAIEVLQTSIDTDTAAMVVDLAALEVDLAAIEVLQTAIDALLTTIDADTGAMVTDLAAIEVLQTTIAGDTTSIDTDTSAMVVDIAALEVDLAAVEVLLTSMDTDTAAMVVDLAALEVDLAAIEVDIAAIEVLQTSIEADTSAMVVDLAAIEVLQTTIAGDTTSIDADTTTIAADTTSIDADTTTIAADTTSIDTDTTTIAGDTTAIQTSIELKNAKLDDDAVAQCVAITASDVDYNIVTAGDWVCMTATGNTAYIRCGTTPAVDHTVGNFSIIVPEGATICERLTGPQCAVIGVTAGGFLCFGHKNSAL